MLLDRLEAFANSLGKCHHINNYTILVAIYLWYNIEIVKKNARAYYVNLDVNTGSVCGSIQFLIQVLETN